MKKTSLYATPPLDEVRVEFSEDTDFTSFPFSLPLIKTLKDIQFPTQVTFFVGENGTGKSTLLEAIAYNAGFGAEGGSKNIHFKTSEEGSYSAARSLGEKLTLSWRHKPKDGYFFRAESFYNVATYLDTLTRESAYAYGPYGGKSLHQQSHGESFFSFFTNRLGAGGFFILDEPEAALSPQRQLSLLVLMHQLCKNPDTQFIIATHSPLLLAYPGATIYSCDSEYLSSISYQETEHYRITKQFLDNPDRYLKYLFEDPLD
jgi:predicted ATPase